MWVFSATPTNKDLSIHKLCLLPPQRDHLFFVFFFLYLHFHKWWRSVMSICLFVHWSKAAMGYVSTWMGDCFTARLVSLMALHLAPVDRNTFRPCYKEYFAVMSLIVVSPAHPIQNHWVWHKSPNKLNVLNYLFNFVILLLSKILPSQNARIKEFLL